MDKLPAGIRNKFLKKQAAKTAGSEGNDSGSVTPNTLHSGTETQVPTPLKSSTPEIPFPQANLEECLACEDPCTAEEQAHYPNYIVKSIDRELPLAGSVKPYGRHILISTGRTDWIHSIDEEDGSVAQGISRGLYESKFGGRKREGEPRIVLSNTSFAPRRIGSGKTEVVVMPEWKLIRGVSKDTTPQFVQRFIDGNQVENELSAETLPFHSMVLICSHAKRDKRCGVTSKYLTKAFESGLRRRNLYRSFDDTRTEAQGGLPGGGTVLGCLSHIGGHKFAGNVIIYRRRTKSVDQLHEKLKGLTLTTVDNPEDADLVKREAEDDVQAEGIWLGRVEPKHVEAIIEEVILKGRVFKDLYRGGLPSKYASLQF
jgi:(2Fe-2S) ferredoxin